MIVGIDPGATGALAWLSDDGHLVAVEDLPMIKVKVGKSMRSRLAASLLVQLFEQRRPVCAFLEETNANGKNGAIANYQLGNCSGQIEGVLSALGISIRFVKPAEWQRHHGRGADKGASRAQAMRTWPGLAGAFARVRDDGRAEAALIGAYGAARMQGMADSVGPLPQLRMSVPVQPLAVR